MPTVIASGIGRQQPETVTRDPPRVLREYDGSGPHMPKPPREDRRRRLLRISLIGRAYPTPAEAEAQPRGVSATTGMMRPPARRW